MWPGHEISRTDSGIMAAPRLLHIAAAEECRDAHGLVARHLDSAQLVAEAALDLAQVDEVLQGLLVQFQLSGRLGLGHCGSPCCEPASAIAVPARERGKTTDSLM